MAEHRDADDFPAHTAPRGGVQYHDERSLTPGWLLHPADAADLDVAFPPIRRAAAASLSPRSGSLRTLISHLRVLFIPRRARHARAPWCGASATRTPIGFARVTEDDHGVHAHLTLYGPPGALPGPYPGTWT
jgi:hypothetical protein